MKIDRLVIENFVGFDHADLDLHDARTAVLYGWTGSGKTTTFDALAALFTGTGLGERSYDRKDCKFLARKQGTPWKVTAWLQVVGMPLVVSRTATTLKSGTTEDAMTETTQAALWKVCGLDERILRATFDVWQAQDMKPADRRALALDLLGIRPTEKDLKEAGLVHPELLSFALAGNWKKALATATELRRGFKRAREAITVPVVMESNVTIGGVQTPCGNVTEERFKKLEAFLGQKRTERDTLMQELARGEGVADRTADNVRLEEVLGALTSYEAVKKELDAEEKLANEAASDLRQMRANLDETKRTVVQNETLLTKFAGYGKEHPCPLCGLKHTGSVDHEIVAGTQKIVADAKTKAVEYEKEIPVLAARTNPQSLVALRASMKALDGFEAERKILEARIAEPVADRTELLRKRMTLDNVEKQIKVGVEIIDTIRVYRAAVQQRTIAEGQTGKLKTQEEAIGQQEDLLKPDGLPKTYFSDVRGKIEQALASWGELKLLPWPLKVDDEFEVHTPSGPFRIASRSERWRVGVALASTLASMSVKFLAVDEADRLLPSDRPALLKFLHAAPLDQVIVTIALEKEPTAYPEGCGVVAFHVKDATARRVNP